MFTLEDYCSKLPFYFGKGLILMIIGLYTIILSMAFNVLFSNIMGNLLIIYSATVLSKGFTRTENKKSA